MDANDDDTDPSSKQTRGGTLTKEQHQLFVRFLRTRDKPARHELKNAGLLDSPTTTLKNGHGGASRFRAWAKKMSLRENDKVLIFKKSGKEILCREQFEDVVRAVNKSSTGTHLSFSVTLAKLREKYTMGKRQFGMGEDTVREVLLTCTSAKCPCKKVKRIPKVEVIPPKAVRGSKSCSALTRRDIQTSSKLSKPSKQSKLKSSRNQPGQIKTNKNTQSSSREDSKPSAPVAYYTLLNLAEFASLAPKGAVPSEKSNDNKGNVILLGYQSTGGCRALGQSVGQTMDKPAGQSAAQTIAQSFQTNNQAVVPTSGQLMSLHGTVMPPSSIVQPISSSISTSSLVGQPPVYVAVSSGNINARPASDLSQRSILYRICSNQQTLSNLAMSTVNPPSMLPCVSRQLIGEDQPKVMETATPKDPLSGDFMESLKGSQSDLDWETFSNSWDMFGESPGKTNVALCANTREKQEVSEVPPSKPQNSRRPVKSNQSFPSFLLQNDTSIAYPEMWYYHKDILKETNMLKRTAIIVDDMKLDMKQSLMGMKPAMERLKKKIAVVESLVQRCKVIAKERKKLNKERKKERIRERSASACNLSREKAQKD